ncbi:SpoIIE family protein phosphatase [Amycolatopsis solani]|uniref:SpoIIE family protein phosphatase n=1 Tax=Amycolatopsis solani TaxID=3028615 RepID=UPI0025B1AA58|nr:SpoIIE family protein phosphatase [Amycolatopsis sp. MEP2-6]
MDELDQRVGPAAVVRERFDAMGMLVAFYQGPELRTVGANAAFRAFAGRDDVIGRTFDELLPELTAQRISPLVHRVFTTGEVQIGREWRFQVDGDEPEARREFFLDFIAEPYRDAGGTVVGVTGIATDVTEQVRLRQAEQQRTLDAERRYDNARDTITALQRQLLPPGLPVLPSVHIAGSYLLADAADAAGGDWFDAISLSGGRVALVVGDVVGHGVAASAAMGQLRAVLQDRLDESGDALVALAAVDRMATRVPEARAATVCIVVLDPADGTFSWCSAGHPPPLIIAGAKTRFLPAAGTRPLGTGAVYATSTDRLDPGDLVLLYSDGIIERPGREPAAAMVELAQVAADAVAGHTFSDSEQLTAERACTHILELLVRDTGHTDDITLLAAQCHAAQAPLRLKLDFADGDNPITAVRKALTVWLTRLGTGPEDILTLTHAAVELVTNAADHAHPDIPGGTATLTAELTTDGRVRMRVSDEGKWRERARPGSEGFREHGGLGLAMTRQFVDQLDIDPGPAGTTATVHHRLSRPSRLLTAEQLTGTTPATAPEELTLLLDQPHAPSNRVAVHGPLDGTTADKFAAELDRYTLGGTHTVTVDLIGVSHLASAAIAVLLARRASLRLYAPPETVAHHVLSVVGLEHHSGDPDVA